MKTRDILLIIKNIIFKLLVFIVLILTLCFIYKQLINTDRWLLRIVYCILCIILSDQAYKLMRDKNINFRNLLCFIILLLISVSILFFNNLYYKYKIYQFAQENNHVLYEKSDEVSINRESLRQLLGDSLEEGKINWQKEREKYVQDDFVAKEVMENVILEMEQLSSCDIDDEVVEIVNNIVLQNIEAIDEKVLKLQKELLYEQREKVPIEEEASKYMTQCNDIQKQIDDYRIAKQRMLLYCNYFEMRREEIGDNEE